MFRIAVAFYDPPRRKWNEGECENHLLQHSPEYLGWQFRALFDEKDNISSPGKHDAMQYTRKQDVQDLFQFCPESERDKAKSCSIRIGMVEKLLACFLVKVFHN